MTVIKNKIPDVSNLLKKRDYDPKIWDIEDKYITTADNNKFTKDIVDKKIKSKGLVDKSVIVVYVNNADLG